MNCLMPGVGNGRARVGQGIRAGVPGGVLLSIALLTAGWDLPVAVAEGTPLWTRATRARMAWPLTLLPLEAVSGSG